MRNEGLQPNLRSPPKHDIREARTKVDNLNRKVGRIGMNTKWEEALYICSVSGELNKRAKKVDSQAKRK